MKKIDMHCHVLPTEAFGQAGKWGPELYEKNGRMVLRTGSSTWTMTDVMNTPLLVRPEARIPDMDRKGVDIHIVCSTPTMFFYHIDHDLAVHWTRECNKALALWPKAFPNRFRFFANLPLGDIDAALEEVDRALDLGAVGFSMGAPAASHSLDEEYFYPLYERLNDLNIPIFMHPVQPGIDTDREGETPDPSLDFSKVNNVLRARVGVLAEETLTMASLIIAGTFDRFPNLRFCIPHAGGAMPLHWGRLEETAEKHPGAKKTTKPFREYLKNFYVDAIVHDPRGRKFIVDIMGASNVIVGSNYGGWDAFDGFGAIEELNLPQADKDKIMGGNAARLFKIE